MTARAHGGTERGAHAAKPRTLSEFRNENHGLHAEPRGGVTCHLTAAAKQRLHRRARHSGVRIDPEGQASEGQI